MRSRRPSPDRGAAGASPELRSFGRLRGRGLSPRQRSLLEEKLPLVALDLAQAPARDPQTLFASPLRAAWLEIGFGGAEHLLWQARANPAVGLIGCEVFEDGVVKALAGIETHALTNVRLCRDDARDLLRWLPPESVERAFALFPDPWPKKRHAKRRLVTRAFLDLVARVLRPAGEVRIATDVGSYAQSIVLAAHRHPSLVWLATGPRDWRERPPDWPQTRYEAKAAGEGRRCYFFRFRKQSGR